MKQLELFEYIEELNRKEKSMVDEMFRIWHECNPDPQWIKEYLGEWRGNGRKRKSI